jgi:hypothetical protein
LGFLPPPGARFRIISTDPYFVWHSVDRRIAK